MYYEKIVKAEKCGNTFWIIEEKEICRYISIIMYCCQYAKHEINEEKKFILSFTKNVDLGNT